MDPFGFLGYLFSFALGLVVGSFVNVVIYRFNTGLTLGGRSKCLHCNTTLAPRDLIPLLSFALAQAKCRYCGSKISWQYPVVEGLAGVIFALIFGHFGWLPFTLLFYWSVTAILLVIAGYDFKHKIIPDFLVYLLAGVALAGPIITGFDDWLLAYIANRLIHDLLSGAVFYGAFWALWRVSKGRWIGLGDAKLALAIGFLLGFSHGLTAILAGFWLGAIFGLGLILLREVDQTKLPSFLRGVKINLKSELPFAPFLIAGVLIVIITNFNVLPF